MRSLRRLLAPLILLSVGVVSSAAAYAAPLTLGATTSVRDSGLLDRLLRAFRNDEGLDLRAIVQGSGAIMRMAESGDVDLLLVHDPPAEEAFIAAGFGRLRRPVMYNDFIIVGPSDDPARASGTASAADAFARIATLEVPFASRGDDSGTHKAEVRVWAAAGIEPDGRWYRETGSGQGATLNLAAAVDAYALTDRATWSAFGNRQRLIELFTNSEELRNPYSIILVPAARHTHVQAEAARTFRDWLTGVRGQTVIASFTIDGIQPFVPAHPPAREIPYTPTPCKEPPCQP